MSGSEKISPEPMSISHEVGHSGAQELLITSFAGSGYSLELRLRVSPDKYHQYNSELLRRSLMLEALLQYSVVLTRDVSALSKQLLSEK